MRHKLGAQHIGQALVQRGHAVFGLQRFGAGAPLLDQLAFVPDGKAHVGAHQRVAPDGFNAVRQFGGVGLQKFAPGWRGVKQLAHFDAGATAARGRLDLAGAAVQLPSVAARAGVGFGIARARD